MHSFDEKMDAHMKALEAKFAAIDKSAEATKHTLSRMDRTLSSIETTLGEMNKTLSANPGWPGLAVFAAIIVGATAVFLALS